jgi:hypothetical protein
MVADPMLVDVVPGKSQSRNVKELVWLTWPPWR